ncbi:potassium channel family protein [Natrarchaeobaculum sulfurireducens]|uniref:Potassium channel protein n=1 Tax=Natrarchaeobaculum sulfurireducens TaxID=2044521 RepID=A0A346PSH3_9EURY|nr:NAD-binding protein [Natrarchaeobaculum sulfurireducens]AXR82468.1 Potassium channel protein [Natrarchaeobaculum sulfurireducens]
MSTSTLSITEETNWPRRIALTVAGVIGLIVVYTYIYQWAVWTFVGEEISVLQALQVVTEALTTAGFGGDTDLWRQSDALALLVVAMNLSGVLLVFLIIPLYAVPLFRQAMETRPPTTSDLTDHVIICGYSAQDEVLRKELQAVNIPYLYVESDPELVTELNERGLNAIVGDLESSDTYRAANATHAQALVADIDDETNPTVILSANQVNPDLRTISCIKDIGSETYHRYAGADDIVSTRQLLGTSLGLRAAGTYAEKLQQAIEVESDLRVTGLLVEKGSDLVGQTLREARAFDQIGVTIVGAWIGGKFVVTPDPDTEIEENTILLVAGEQSNFEGVQTRQIPAHHEHEPRVVVCGYGTVGQSVVETVQAEGLDADAIDIAPKDGVDIHGDITEPETFERANVEDARAVVLSIDEDTTTIYATLILNQLAPDTEIVARADDDDTVQKLYNAGADFVLSLSNLTGESLASLLVEETEILTPDVNFEFIRTSVLAFTGQSLSELDLRKRTGCTVVAVERGGNVLTDISANFTIEEDDVLIVAGSEASRNRFHQLVAEMEKSDKS